MDPRMSNPAGRSVLADMNFPTSSICKCGPEEIRADGEQATSCKVGLGRWGWSWPQLPRCYSSAPTSTHSPSTHQ